LSSSNPTPAGGPHDHTVHIFVAYAHEDRRWFDPEYRFNLIPFLKESLRRDRAEFWFDKELMGGDEYKRLIESQIDKAQIALLMVSQHFLNSEFIETFELPRIAARAERKELVVVPVLVEPCGWIDYPFLADRQMVPGSSPLIHFTESEARWADVRFQILEGLKTQVKRIRDDGVRRVREEIERREHEEKERQGRGEKERRDREEKERSEREEAQRKQRGEMERKEREARQRREREEKERKGREDKQREERDGQEKRETPSPLHAWLLRARGLLRDRALLRSFRLLAVLGALVCAIVLFDFLFHLWFSHAGAKWTPLKSGVDNSFYSIAGSADGRILFTCGSGNAFLNSSDGGATWTNRNTGANANCDVIFSTLDGRQIWTPAIYKVIENASGAFLTSEIFSSTDGGATWQTEQLTNAADWPHVDLFKSYFDQFYGAPGTTSKPSSSPSSTLDLTPSSGSSSSTAPPKPVIDIKGIAGTPDGKRLWAAGDKGEIYESDNGGSSWEPRSSGIKTDLSAIGATSDATFFVAAGTNGAIVQSGTGATWFTQTSGVTAALKAIFVAANASTVCIVGEKGTILVSTDKGVTWRTEGGGTLLDLQGVFGTSDGKHLWIVGNSGTILESDDRGSDWHDRPSGTNKNLRAIFGTSDGKRLWAAGDNGIILESKSSLLY
jgi:photosystem II stability/assembly factor-like uncharacterized protein